MTLQLTLSLSYNQTGVASMTQNEQRGRCRHGHGYGNSEQFDEKKMYKTVTHVQQNVKVFNVKWTKLFLQRHVPDLTRARQFPVSNMLHIDNKLKTEAEMLPERFSKNQEKDKSEKIKNTALLGFINSLKCRYRMSYKKLTNFTNKCWAT